MVNHRAARLFRRVSIGTGSRGGTTINNHFSPTFNVTQNPGEDGDAFATRGMDILIENERAIA